MEIVKIKGIEFLINLNSALVEKDGIIFHDSRKQSETNINSAHRIIVSNFRAFDKIDIIKEMSGQSDYFYSLAKSSLDNKNTIFCGVKTMTAGVECDNVIVTSKGVLVDIISPTYLSCEEHCGGDKIKIFQSGDVAIGLLLGSDCMEESNWQKVAPLSDIMVCIANSGSIFMRECARELAKENKISSLYVDNAVYDYHEQK